MAYEGHDALSPSKYRGQNSTELAPADRANFNADDAQWADEPGAGARTNRYPRDDARSQ